MKLTIEKSVVVITPSIGKRTLEDAVASVRNQTYGNLKHLVVADGEEFETKVRHTVVKYLDNTEKLVVTSTPWNTGAKGFYGHRIYAAYPHLIDADYVFFLDEDNWYLPDHVSTMVETLEKRSPSSKAAYSLRSIYDVNGEYLVDDNCESLGKWSIWVAPEHNPSYLVDTSSWCFRGEFIKNTCQFWHHGWGGDRNYLYNTFDMQYPLMNADFACSNRHTLAYRLDGNPNSVTEEFFHQGNDVQLKRYNGKLPWLLNSQLS